MRNTYFGVFCLSALLSFGAYGATVKLQLKLGSNEPIVLAADNSQMNRISAFNKSIFFTRFANAQKQSAERRLKVFKSLFEDEVEPYTGKSNPKSKCLIKAEAMHVQFHSGPDVAWADCASAKTPLKSVRLWQLCGSDLWEVTIQGMDSFDQALQLRCF